MRGAGNEGRAGASDLRTVVAGELLPTPVTQPMSGNGHARHLGAEVGELLPTPRAARGASATETAYALGGERSDDARPQGEVLLPTPVAKDADAARARRDDGSPISPNGHEGTTLTDAVALLPTPSVADVTGGHKSRSGDRSGELLLPGIVENLLPTPTVNMTRNENESPEEWEARRARVATTAPRGGNGIGLPLTQAVQMLPTPLVSDGKAPHPNETERVDRPAQLRAITQLLPTPTRWEQRGDPATDDRNLLPLEAVRIVQTDDGEIILDETDDGAFIAWGKYRPAIKRTEAVLGRRAPQPAIPDGRKGNHRLASRFVEWMMMLRLGHVTGRGLSRAQELARLGNGVVPIQAGVATALGIRRLVEIKRADS